MMKPTHEQIQAEGFKPGDFSEIPEGVTIEVLLYAETDFHRVLHAVKKSGDRFLNADNTPVLIAQWLKPIGFRLCA